MLRRIVLRHIGDAEGGVIIGRRRPGASYCSISGIAVSRLFRSSPVPAPLASAYRRRLARVWLTARELRLAGAICSGR